MNSQKPDPKSIRPSVAILALLCVGLFLSACRGEKIRPVVLAVIHFHDEVRLLRNDREMPLTLGMRLTAEDVIETRNGHLEFQSTTGVVIRVSHYSRVRVAPLLDRNGRRVRLDLKQGGLLATLDTQQLSEGLDITAPTAVASVRATTFFVELQQEGRSPRIKVLKGRVAVRPRVPALEEYSAEEIQSSEALKDLQAKLVDQERVVETATAAVLNELAEAEVLQLQKELVEAREKQIDPREIAPLKVEEVVAAKENVQLEKSVITPREEAEKETLLAIKDELIEKVSAEPDPELSRQIQDDHRQKEEEALKNIEEKARQRELKTEEELRQHYRLLEVVTMNDGEKLRGVIVAHTGSVIIMHTTRGLRRLNEKEVNYIQYVPR